MNISIIGSCQSRDMFNSKFVENYKEYFTVSSYFTMTSMLSLMSGPIDYNYDKLLRAGFKETLLEHWFQQFEKTMLKTLESVKPDILLMDFYADARRGAISYAGEYFTDRNKMLKEKDIIDFNKLGIRYNYLENKEDFFMMWKNAFDRFMDFMKMKLPNTQIIINTVKGTNIVENDKGEKYYSEKIKHLNIAAMNEIWTRMDNYAVDKYHLKALRFEKEYTLDPNYLFGGVGYATVHFHDGYYKDCFAKLLDVTADIKGQKKNNESDVNLVIDSSYKCGLKNWTNLLGKFEIINYQNYRAIRVADIGEERVNSRPQMWSKPIEVIGDGQMDYTLSFYVKIPDLSKLDDDCMIFAIRTFKYMSQIKFSEAIDTYKITLKDHEIKENQEYRYVFTFRPNGKYIKLAPFMFDYIPGVEYSRIKLERAQDASEYTK